MRCTRLSLALLLVSCGRESRVEPGPVAPADAPAPAPTTTPGTQVQATGTVLESDAHGPQLCLGGVLESLPPQCSGVPLVGWNWDAVEGEQRAQKTTWGEYHVIGSFDGASLTPTRPPGPPQPWPETSTITTPCSEPAGGWARPDPRRATAEAIDRANAAAQAQPDFAGLWIHDPNQPVGEHQDMSKVVLNVAFTGDLERHTAELRKHWGGALCVVAHKHTEAALLKIQDSLQATLRELGVELLSSSTDVVAGVVRADVVLADAGHQAKLDERHGPGVVVLSSRLHPAP